MTNDNNKKIQSLDSLRGVLSFLVVIAHAWQTFIHPLEIRDTPAQYVFGLLARFAVLCFFCLSGYVITLSIDLNRVRHGAFGLWDFFLARAFRITPPLLLVFAITFLAELALIFLGADLVNSDWTVREIYATDIALQLKALRTFCTQGDLTGGGFNGPLWTLAYEIQLYVMAGLLAYALFANRIWLRIIAFLVLFHYLRRIGFSLKRVPALDIQTVSFLSFGFGSIAYLWRGAPRALLLTIAAVLVPSIFAVAVLASSEDILRNLDTSREWLIFQALVSIGFSLMVLAIARSGKFNQLHKMGEYSYTLYIAHFPLLVLVYFLLHHFFPEILNPICSLLIAMLSVVFVLGVSMFMGHLIEQPGTQRKLTFKLFANLRTKVWARK